MYDYTTRMKEINEIFKQTVEYTYDIDYDVEDDLFIVYDLNESDRFAQVSIGADAFMETKSSAEIAQYIALASGVMNKESTPYEFEEMMSLKGQLDNPYRNVTFNLGAMSDAEFEEKESKRKWLNVKFNNFNQSLDEMIDSINAPKKKTSLSAEIMQTAQIAFDQEMLGKGDELYIRTFDGEVVSIRQKEGHYEIARPVSSDAVRRMTLDAELMTGKDIDEDLDRLAKFSGGNYTINDLAIEYVSEVSQLQFELGMSVSMREAQWQTDNDFAQ